MTPASDAVGGRARPGNPFPGLRPFESNESALFFGREEQCDDLLMRLERRRLVAVVGMSGSGKSSLVRAGLLPALDRGYLPNAGSSWHIAIFRPGSDPVANLARALATRRLPGGAVANEDTDSIRRAVDTSSLGLAAAARQLLHDTGDSLLVVADQFEELFRFGRIAANEDAVERAANCVDLLLNATRQDEIPVFIVLTMRSDYLGDCARFTGLPEALNDSQFLVPRMARAQLREAIESPVAVGGAQISYRLVQRLLHDVDDMSPSAGDSTGAREQDQLPVLQHALMRMWEVSRDARERGEPIDLPHYERPPVETLRYALDRHAEETYQELPTDSHRDVARLIFQQLTDRDAENREVRRPTPIGELKTVALQGVQRGVAPPEEHVVDDVVEAFSSPGRAFVVVNQQGDVDISHESFIRNWARLHEWVERESRSRRVYMKLVDAASSWERKEGSLYRGPELAEARRWWDQEGPSESWGKRYDSRFDVARRFLNKSIQGRRVRGGLFFGNVGLLLVAATATTIVTRNSNLRLEEANGRLAEANVLYNRGLALQKEGKDSQANELFKQAQQVNDKGSAVAPPPASADSTELERLRRDEKTWQQKESDLRSQLAALQAVPPAAPAAAPTAPVQNVELTAAERNEMERLRRTESTLERDITQIRQQLAAANDRLTRSQQAEASLRGTIEEMRARPPATGDPVASRSSDRTAIEQLLRDYQDAYERLDFPAVARIMPSVKSGNLERTFSQVRSYRVEFLDQQISVTGDTATVTCTQRTSIDPKVGRREVPRQVASVFKLRRSNGVWTIESFEEKR